MKYRFRYKGGVYYFRNTISPMETVITEASTKEKAISNIKFQLKTRFKLEPWAKLDIDNSKVKKLVFQNGK